MYWQNANTGATEKNMINIITNKIFKFLINNSAVSGMDSFEIEWIRYGIEITVSSLLGFLIALTISVLLNRFICGLLFLFVFVSVRKYVGGFHANSYLSCNLTFATCCTVLLLSVRFTSGLYPYFINAAITAIDFIIIILISPIENKNKPIGSKRQYLKLKLIGSILFLIAGFLGTLLLYYGLTEYGSTVLYTLHLITLLAVIGLIIEMNEMRKNKHEE